MFQKQGIFWKSETYFEDKFQQCAYSAGIERVAVLSKFHLE